MSTAIEFLRCLSEAQGAKDYLSVQAEAIDALDGKAKELIQIATDEGADRMMRFDAMQLLTWISPKESIEFFVEQSNCADEEIALLAQAMAFRLTTRSLVEEHCPENFADYLSALRDNAAKALF